MRRDTSLRMEAGRRLKIANNRLARIHFCGCARGPIMSSGTTLETKTPPPTTEGGDSRRGRFDFSKPSEGPSAVFAKPVGQGKKRPPRSKDAQAKVAKEVKVPKESPKKPKAAVKEEPLPQRCI